MITNTLVISKDHKQIFFYKNKDSKDRFEMIAQVCEKSKCVKKKTQRKYLKKNFLINKRNEEQNRIPKTCISLIFSKF